VQVWNPGSCREFAVHPLVNGQLHQVVQHRLTANRNSQREERPGLPNQRGSINDAAPERVGHEHPSGVKYKLGNSEAVEGSIALIGNRPAIRSSAELPDC
jgi:hypothetical protein